MAPDNRPVRTATNRTPEPRYYRGRSGRGLKNQTRGPRQKNCMRCESRRNGFAIGPSSPRTPENHARSEYARGSKACKTSSADGMTNTSCGK